MTRAELMPTFPPFPEWVKIGAYFDVGEGTVIGSEGFGYEKDDWGGWVRRPHEFGVVIGDNVSIGANTTIDRGRYRDTVIGHDTKIDNLVHIAHNVRIGKRCLIIAHAMIAGSATLGDDVWVGPGAQISDHVTVGDGARIGMGAVVLRDVPPGETWVGNPAKRLRAKNEAGGLQRLTQLLDMNEPRIFWRHDVDYDLDCALRMAELESLHGIRATYYFLPDSEDYKIDGELIRRIRDLGHVIGTHVDLRLPRDGEISDNDLEEACLGKRALLSSHCGFLVDLRRVSFHQPPGCVIGREVRGWFESAQGPEWQGVYAADSRGVFNVEPEKLIAETDGPVQINLHPEWWFLPPDEADALRRQEATKP